MTGWATGRREIADLLDRGHLDKITGEAANGDYLLASKWSYGFSKYSLPFSLPLIPGRIFASQPDRGDIVIFKAPPGNDTDYIKRVIGLPGDTVQVRAGQVFLNGKAVPRQRGFPNPDARCVHQPADRRLWNRFPWNLQASRSIPNLESP